MFTSVSFDDIVTFTFDLYQSLVPDCPSVTFMLGRLRLPSRLSTLT